MRTRSVEYRLGWSGWRLAVQTDGPGRDLVDGGAGDDEATFRIDLPIGVFTTKSAYREAARRRLVVLTRKEAKALAQSLNAWLARK
jgi:hypothetical protein